MSLCVVDGQHCRCQPEENSPCPGVVQMRSHIAELERALRQIAELPVPLNLSAAGKYLDQVRNIARSTLGKSGSQT